MNITSKIKVSVNIITYNHQNYIRQAIESVLNQDVTFNFEIIIADDRSTDKTTVILKEFEAQYPDLIKLILRDENIGTTRNICDAFAKSKGEYLIGFGGDDYWIDNKKLQIQTDWLDSHPDYLGVSHVMEMRNNEGISSEKFPDPKIIGKTVTPEDYLNRNYFYTSTTLFRNIFQSEKAVDYIHLITSSRLVEDVSLAMILLNLGKVYVLERCMSVYRQNLKDRDSNYNSFRNPLQALQDHIEVYKANYRFFSGKYDFSKLYAIRALHSFIWSIKTRNFFLFFGIFNEVPLKAKIYTLFYFPIYLLKALLFKVKSFCSF